MSKKFGKFLLFSAVAGVAAYGAYTYLQKNQQPVSADPEENTDDDFDDFSEDLDEDLSSGKNRSYVSLNLDKAEAFASETFQKAKDVFTDSVQQMKETVKSVADSHGYHTSFTDLTHVASDSSDKVVSPEADDAVSDDEPTAANAEADDAANHTAEESDTAEDTAKPVYTAEASAKETVEEFFDDEP